MSYAKAGQWGPELVTQIRGGTTVVALPTTSVTVQTMAGATATIYTDRNATTTAANPVTTDSAGNLSFFAFPGQYKLAYTGPSGPSLLPITVNLDPADTNPDVFANAHYVAQQVGTPEKIQLDGSAIDASVPHLAHEDGTVASPRTDTSYKTPVVYVERHTNSTSANSSSWGNAKKNAAFLAEVVAYGAETGEVNGFASRVFSATAKPSGAQPLIGMSALAQSNAPAGQANRDVYGANFIAASSSGNTPTDLVGVEVDLIPSTSVTDIRPGQTNAQNVTAYWAQSAGGVNANTAFYASSTSGSVGWLYGVVIDAPVVHSTGYFRNTVNAAGNTGLYVETQYGAAAGYAVQVVAASNEQFRVDGASDNPISIRVNSSFRNVVVGAADSAGTGFRTLRVAN